MAIYNITASFVVLLTSLEEVKVVARRIWKRRKNTLLLKYLPNSGQVSPVLHEVTEWPPQNRSWEKRGWKFTVLLCKTEEERFPMASPDATSPLWFTVAEWRQWQQEQEQGTAPDFEALDAAASEAADASEDYEYPTQEKTPELALRDAVAVIEEKVSSMNSIQRASWDAAQKVDAEWLLSVWHQGCAEECIHGLLALKGWGPLATSEVMDVVASTKVDWGDYFDEFEAYKEIGDGVYVPF